MLLGVDDSLQTNLVSYVAMKFLKTQNREKC